MKKIFTLIAAATLALGASAQTITWSSADVTKTKQNPEDASKTIPDENINGKTYGSGGFIATVVDEIGFKAAVDANNAYFGTSTDYTKYEYRFKSGGKNGTEAGTANRLDLTIPSAGTLKVCARTGSNSATDRTLVITQNGSELYNKVVVESDAVTMSGKNTKVYPIISVAVEAGTVSLSWPVNSINIYALELVAGEGGGEEGGGEGGDTPTPVDGTVLIDYPTLTAGTAASGSTTITTVKIHNNKDAIACYKLANGYTTEGAYNNNSINLTLEGGFKAGDVITIAGAVNVDTSKSENAGKRATAVLFSLDATNNITVLNTFSDFINGRVTSDDLQEESFTLTEDVPALYLGRDGNTAANVTLIKVTRPVPAAISSVTTTATAAPAVKKYVENGKVVIVKDGKKFNIAGAQLK